MRYQRTGLGAAVLAVLAATAVGVAGPAQAGLVTSCTGTASDLTVPGDLFVPAGQSCELTNVTVTGNTTVRADADLILTSSSLAGTLTVAGNAFADLEGSTVAGVSRLNGAFGLFSHGSTLTGNLTVTDSGFAYSVESSFGGNINSTNGETYLQSGRLARNLSTTGDLLTDLHDTVVEGRVTVSGTALGSVVCTSEVDGDTSFSGAAAAGVLQLGAPGPADVCGFDVFAGGLTVTGNHAPATISDNVVRGAVACTDNDTTPTGSDNRLRGGATGQCADLLLASTADRATNPAAAAGASTAAVAGADKPGAAATGTDDRVADLLVKINSRRSTSERAATAAGPAQIHH
jgi:hypothetical protein